MGKVYTGLAGGRVSVVVDGESWPLDPRLDLRNHSPDGFAWGYPGPGPSQLALAILADHCPAGNNELVLKHYVSFRRAMIEGMEVGVPFELPDHEVADAVAKIINYHEKERRL